MTDFSVMGQVIFMLLVSVYVMLQSSFAMLEKRSIVLFLPILLVGLELCVEASLFYFNIPLSDLPGYLHDVFLIFALLFYIFLGKEVLS